MRYRIEKDLLGEKIIPAEAYYGINSLRSKEAFEITKHGLCRQNIKALANIKKAQAKINHEFKLLDSKRSEAIMLSCDEILNGRLHGQFITDSIQDGYGFGMNINACEVIANRANEMLGGDKGKYDKVSVEDVDMCQDVDEVITLTGKMTANRLLKKLVAEGKKLINAYLELSNKITVESLKEQVLSFSEVLEKDLKKLEKNMSTLMEINYGKNVSINGEEKEEYLKRFVKSLNSIATEKFVLSKNQYVPSRNLDCFMNVSSSLKNMMVDISRSAVDLKSIVKNGSLYLPVIEVLNKKDENTVVLDVVKQISYYIIGNDITISRCVEDGELETNVLKPMIFACLFESSNLVRRTIRMIREKVIEIIEVK